MNTENQPDHPDRDRRRILRRVCRDCQRKGVPLGRWAVRCAECTLLRLNGTEAAL